MRKREFEEAWAKVVAADKSVANLTASNRYLYDYNRELERANAELRAELDRVKAALKDAEDAAWMAEAKQDIYVEAATLKPFHMAPLSCPYCGGEDISTSYRGRCDPLIDDGNRYKGHPAHMYHFCRGCGAALGETKTLEASL